MDQTQLQSGVFTRQVLIAAGIAVAIVLALLLGWYFAHVLLLVFAGILLAVLLRGLAEWLSSRTPLSRGWSLTLVIVLLFVAMGGGIWLLGPSIANSFDQLAQTMPQALDRVQGFIRQHDTAQQILDRFLQRDKSTIFSGKMFTRIAGIFSTLVGVITGFLIILVSGIYFSVEPRVYINGIVRLVTPSRRDRARAIFEELGHVLRWWLVGRIISMVLVGILTWIGLSLLGIPAAAALGLLAGLLSFVPNLGPILSAVPAVLAGLMQSPMMALYVVLLYIAIQTVESYLITPLIQRRTIELPPALILTVQLAMGFAFGILGLLLATPFAVVMLILIQMLYVQDVLGDKIDLP